MSDFVACIGTEEQARVSCSNLIASSGFMRNSITAGGAFFPPLCISCNSLRELL